MADSSSGCPERAVMTRRFWARLGAPDPEAATAGLLRGVRSLEFLERTVTKSNERTQRST